MDEYTLEFTRIFVQQFGKLDRSIQKQVYSKILKLKSNPFRHKPLKGPFKGCYRLHVGNYRVIYLPKRDQKKVFLIDVDLRSRVYRKDLTKFIEKISGQTPPRK